MSFGAELVLVPALFWLLTGGAAAALGGRTLQRRMADPTLTPMSAEDLDELDMQAYRQKLEEVRETGTLRLPTNMVDSGLLEKGLQAMGVVPQAGSGLRVGDQTIDGFVVNAEGKQLGLAWNGASFDVVCARDAAEAAGRFVSEAGVRYSYAATMDKLEAQGFALVDEQKDGDGRIHLKLRRVS